MRAVASGIVHSDWKITCWKDKKGWEQVKMRAVARGQAYIDWKITCWVSQKSLEQVKIARGAEN